MSKKTNTILFIIGGTIFNVLTTILGFILLVIILSNIINLTGADPEAVNSWGIPLVFVGAIVLSFFAYRLVLKLIQKKIDMEKYFDPLFGPRRPPRKP